MTKNDDTGRAVHVIFSYTENLSEFDSCSSQRDLGVKADGVDFLLATVAVLDPPGGTARRGQIQMKAAAIMQLLAPLVFAAMNALTPIFVSFPLIPPAMLFTLFRCRLMTSLWVVFLQDAAG